MTSNHSTLEAYCDHPQRWFRTGMPASEFVGVDDISSCDDKPRPTSQSFRPDGNTPN